MVKCDDKSDEYRIRRCTVEKLLSEGWKRDDIRLEIPMSTASSGGRVDIVCLADYIGCIELKSGRDKLESDLLAAQLSQYKRAFDHTAVIADSTLYKSVECRTAYSVRVDDNFRHVDLAYRYNFYTKKGVFQREPRKSASDKEPPEVQQITPILFQNHWGKCRYTSVIDMAQILWADELRQIFGKGTKSGLELKAKEEMGVKQFRPLLISALRSRPLNEWEAKFWAEFDGAKTVLAQETDYARGAV